MVIRDPRDFWAGVLFVALGMVAVLIGRDYEMGSAGRMGPGYFPAILGALLALAGMALSLRALYRAGRPLDAFAVRELLLVLGSVLLFGAIVRGAGLAPAVLLLVLGSGCASRRFRFWPCLALAAGLAVSSVVVFVHGLGLPLAAVGPWLGA